MAGTKSSHTEIPWNRLLAEAAAIVASILLAFGIDAWWQERSEKIRTEQLLSALETEWSSELKLIDSKLIEYERATDAIRMALDAHVMDRSTRKPAEDRAMMEAIRWTTYKPSLVAHAMIQSYGLDHVDNPELRLAIAAWPAVLAEVEPEQVALHDLALRKMRTEFVRVAHDLEMPWDETAAPDVLARGVDADLWAAEVIDDHQAMIVIREVFSVLDQYRRQLSDVRSTLANNLAILRSR